MVFEEQSAINLPQAFDSTEEIGTPDVVILGMGTDGHFASLFPHDKSSKTGLEESPTPPLLYTTAPVAPRQRISHSWHYLKQAHHLFLHITGQTKMDLIEEAPQREALPIDVALNDAAANLTIFWTP